MRTASFSVWRRTYRFRCCVMLQSAVANKQRIDISVKSRKRSVTSEQQYYHIHTLIKHVSDLRDSCINICIKTVLCCRKRSTVHESRLREFKVQMLRNSRCFNILRESLWWHSTWPAGCVKSEFSFSIERVRRPVTLSALKTLRTVISVESCYVRFKLSYTRALF